MKHQIYQGELISAGLNLENQEMSIMSIKHVPTVSIWDMNQAKRMHQALSDALDRQDEQFVVTIRDSMPLLLQKGEMQQLQQELNEMLGTLSKHH